MRSLVLALSIATTLAAGCASSQPEPSPSVSVPALLSIGGTVSVAGGVSQNGLDGEPCALAEAGYEDIRDGAQVVITDASSKTIAVGKLGPGKMRRPGGADASDRHCVFAFEVSAPRGHDFYGIEVSHRGRLQYTAAQLQAPLELTLGD